MHEKITGRCRRGPRGDRAQLNRLASTHTLRAMVHRLPESAYENPDGRRLSGGSVSLFGAGMKSPAQATVTGTLEGKTIRVESIRIQ